MSQQLWQNQMRSNPVRIKNPHSADWKALCKHAPLEGRTTDPKALDYDEAVRIFFSGLRQARRGDIESGGAQIATAFLLDGRSINYLTILPAAEAADFVMDGMLLHKLVTTDPNKMSARILMALTARRHGADKKEGQSIISEAMRAMDECITLIEERPEIEYPDSGILGGCLTRPILYFEKSTFHMALGNHKEAIRDLTKALRIDPGYTPARDARANLWASLKLKDHATLHTEFKRILLELHKDDRGNEVSYAWLALFTLEDPRLGSIRDAKHYYAESIRATQRNIELYGSDDSKDPTPVIALVKQKFQAMHTDITIQNIRKGLDTVSISEVPAANADPKRKFRNMCVCCGKNSFENGNSNLMKCSRCKKVSYCSIDCQRKDWKSHKVLCKQAGVTPPSGLGKFYNIPDTSSLAKISDKQEDSHPKDPIDEATGHSRACVRMESELQALFSEHGKIFSEWWHLKSPGQRKEILLKATNNTIPLKQITDVEIQRSLGLGNMSRCLIHYNIQNLVGRCECKMAKGKSLGKNDCQHIYNDTMLHEIYLRVEKVKETEKNEYFKCYTLKNEGTFPNIMPGIHAYLQLSKHNQGPEKYDMTEPFMITQGAPLKVVQEWKMRAEAGDVKDFSAAMYTSIRRLFSLGLFIKLFDLYQEQERHFAPKNPYERLMGCSACYQTAEGIGATRCETCKVMWWCCSGCRMTTSHGVSCPHNAPCATVVTFT